MPDSPIAWHAPDAWASVGGAPRTGPGILAMIEGDRATVRPDPSTVARIDTAAARPARLEFHRNRRDGETGARAPDREGSDRAATAPHRAPARASAP